jgi:hypothetical protein
VFAKVAERTGDERSKKLGTKEKKGFGFILLIRTKTFPRKNFFAQQDLVVGVQRGEKPSQHHKAGGCF